MENKPSMHEENISRRTFMELSVSIIGGILAIDGVQKFVGRVGVVDRIVAPTEISQSTNDQSVVDSDYRRTGGFIQSWFASNAWKLSSSEVLYRFIDQISNKE